MEKQNFDFFLIALNLRYAYEGELCEVQDSCIGNTICSGEKICRCLENYTAKNGLCCM
jgi:hypothetical protein